MKQEETPRADAPSTHPRKRYEKPVLEMYGDLAQITQSVKGKNMKDGASHPNKHFTS
jgi:hypothetical protein